MFFNDGNVCWTASDLTAATTCEYGILRTLDYRLGWAAPIDEARDPLLEHIARLGDAHEARILESLQESKNVAVLPHIERPFTTEKIEAAHQATAEAFAAKPDVIFQPTFFDGEFFGYADFIENTEDGWLVCDAKLARSAKPQALIQLAAYADQIEAMGLPLSPTVSLFLGSGERADFAISDIAPVFFERRERMRELLKEHQDAGSPVAWGDDRYLACGSCPECSAAATASNDLILVAGLRMEQRKKLRATGIKTVSDLAAATTKPASMAQPTFDKLRAQARMQSQQQYNGEVSFELTENAADVLALLPEPSAGDLFFDFEGDPLYSEGDPKSVGLEYLWGVLDAAEGFTPLWAHSSAEERIALEQFIDLVRERRKSYPDLHVYHYAPYETSALKRLVTRYQTRENELDELLRQEVFVDLYSTVRGAVRVSQPSYSIKKLEPLYMGEQLRDSDVADGAGSIVAYHQFRDDRTTNSVAADQALHAIADYNEYDCLSTLRLRDWLLERAVDAGVRDEVAPQALVEEVEVDPFVPNPLYEKLIGRSGADLASERTAEEQAYAMLASSLDYYRRERKQFWWDHFDRLGHPLNDWTESRDIFVIESVTDLTGWIPPEGRKRNYQRMLQLNGNWTPGSSKPSKAFAVFENPGPEKASGPAGALYSAIEYSIEVDPDDPQVVTLIESTSAELIYDDLPVALIPAQAPRTTSIEGAIEELAGQVASATTLPEQCGLDVLSRRRPRLRGEGDLPKSENSVDDLVSALLAMDNSYLAVQGPPGTGKTHNGSRVIKELVEKHGWRIGVVAQSHAVVENMLNGIVKAGLDPSLIGKADAKDPNPRWTAFSGNKVGTFLGDISSTGGVLGGTAWTFTNDNRVPRESLDLLVIDEAGQFSLAPTLGVSVAAKRLLLLGDPQQLPQVSQGIPPEPINESALGWLMNELPTIPSELGFFLADSYRMHPALCRKVSRLSYENRLESAAPASARSLEGVEPGLSVVEVDHSGNRVESPEEAAAVVEQVQAHLGAIWQESADKSPRPLTPGDFLIVAPYNAQVACIRVALDAAGLGEVRVGTVDKFQGQEAPIAMVSMTASSRGDVPRGMEFLLNRNRINVAISRAMWKAILIRSASLSAFMPTSTDGLIQLGAFIRLCQPKEN